MRRAQVFDHDLQQKLYPYMKEIIPMPSVYDPDFVASDQAERANNVIKGDKQTALEHIRNDIKNFKKVNSLDKIIVLWTANTERFSEETVGVHDSAVNLFEAIKNNHPEVSPSTIFAVASILENAPFINGSPQNTLVPGVVDLALKQNVFIAGSDFKTGQTKV
jgi:myo-inositol-1-phosphate synthase